MSNYCKRLLSIVLVISILVTNMCLNLGVVYGDDDFDMDTGWVYISNASELYAFAERVNSGETALNAVLMNDIVVNTGKMTANSTGVMAWTPIGSSDYQYEGMFEGQDHTISGLYYNSYAIYAGLFGYTNSYAEIRDVGVINSYFGSSDEVGGVCGFNLGTIDNSYNTGAVSGGYDVGGVCGYNLGTISNSYNMGDVTGKEVYVGGVCGYNLGTIDNSYNMGAVSGSSNYVGGVCGYNLGTIDNSYNTVTVTSSSSDVGGVCGYNGESTVSNSYNTGDVTGYGLVGGVCGCSYGQVSEVSNSYNTGAVSGSKTTGGICGEVYKGTISNSYNMGDVSGYSYIGGISALNHYATISNSYSTGAVTSSNNYEGSICVGNTDNSVIINCYYLTDTASFDVYEGDGKAETYAKTSSEFASGEVCYLLNESVSGGEVWYQTVGKDDYPILDSTHGKVYTSKSWLCPDYFKLAGYNNEGDTAVTESSEHIYTDDNKCKYCGAERPVEPSLVDGVYQITSEDDFAWLVRNVNGGNNAINAVLASDIELNSADEWTSIGTSDIPYSGTFNGNGHTISGVTISGTSSNVGLFGYTSKAAVIKNLGVIDSTISGNENVGAICGVNNGTITACYTTVVVSGADRVGGICGLNNGTVSYCYHTDGIVSGSELAVGGICGDNIGTVEHCFNTANISGDIMAGSICGSNEGTLTACYYLTGTADSGSGDGDSTAEAKTAAQFNTGEVCYLLNNSSDVDVVFYQRISKDETPSLNRFRGVVYKVGKRYINYCDMGDVNYDDEIDRLDATIILKYISGTITETEFNENYNSETVDYNKDGNVDLLDVIDILVATA